MIARIKGQVSIVQFSGFLRRNLEKSMIPKWGCSSAGRAPALQAGGQEFDPPHLHQVGKGNGPNNFQSEEPFLILTNQTKRAHSSGG